MYVPEAVTGLARHYQQSPDKLTKEIIEDYVLYLKNDKGNTPGTCANVVAGLRFSYNHVADRQVPIDYCVRKGDIIENKVYLGLRIVIGLDPSRP